MKESPAAFERRTGVGYQPPAWLAARGRPLGPRESCPTLFRYPGPEGLRGALGGALRRLAPPGVEAVWLSADLGGERGRAVRMFGTLAILQPLRLQPCATRRRGAYLGVNGDVDDALHAVWVPPSAVKERIAWDRLRTSEDALRRLGRSWQEERERVADRIAAYLEELSELERAGAPRPERPWLSVPLRERRALLARHAVAPRWTAG